jgi:DNA-binding transcriptional regulator LsrR (DeoR family)
MIQNRIQTLLHALYDQPKTPLELATQLGSSEAALRGMIETLERGGYISPAIPPSATGCGHCNLKSMCRVADQNPDTLELHLYRLTPKGFATLQTK